MFERFSIGTVSRERMARDIADAGVRAGDILIVHVSLKSIGRVSGGPADVAFALQDVLTRSGTLLMPTFTFHIAGWGIGAFMYGESPSRTGLVTEAFRRMPGVARSCHPSHSVAVWGRHSREFAYAPLDYTPLGEGSPFDLARQAGAKILLIGVGHDRNSSIHLAECLAPAPYIGLSFTHGREYDIGLIAQPGEPFPLPLPLLQMPGSSEGFPRIEPRLRARGIVTDARVGQAHCQVMDAQRLVDAVVDEIRHDPEVLLDPETPSDISRRRLAYLRTRQELAFG